MSDGKEYISHQQAGEELIITDARICIRG